MKKITFLLVFLALMPFIKNADAQVIEADSLALVDIYNAGDGANWTGVSNWLVTNVSEWEGVTVTGDRVTELGLNQINMGGNGGTLSPSIGNLTGLTRFEIQNAPNLTGSIPAELWNCTNIGRLQIKFTGLTGGIPAGISTMVNVYELNFQQSYLGGTIPAELFELPSLTKAYLHQSNFTGTVPTTVTGATGLTRLYLHENKLEGPLPFVDLPDGQAKVELTGNFFSFADVKQYHDSAATFAAFTDDYQFSKETTVAVVEPAAGYAMTGTVTGGEAYAWFKDDGTIPVGTSETLDIAAVGYNDEGTYTCKAQSTQVANFDIRTIYELSVNYSGRERDSLALVAIYEAGDGANWENASTWLTDSIDKWEGVTVTGGRVTELGLNQINFGGNGGTLSPKIGQLTELTRFEIQNAPNLTGSIPAELWNCTKIGRLQIKFTGLTGGIPAGIESMVNAYELNFQQSYLGGPIPAELFELPSLTHAYLHQSDFTGTVPSTVTGATGLKRLYLQENKLEGPLPFVDLPDGQAKVELTGNFFSFADVKQYHDSAATFAAFTDDYQLAKEIGSVVVVPGVDTTLTGLVTDGESYAWFKDDVTTPLGTSETFVVASVGWDEEGTYTCKAQSSQVANFDIRTIYELSLNYTGRERDSLALVAIYNAGDGANWSVPDTAQWLTGPISDWHGVEFADGRVVTLGLNQMNFGGNGGTLSPMIGQMTALTRFEIQNAPNLIGSIPPELWNCTNIGRLQLKFTGLTGGIPAGIESMVNAYEINFQQSYLGGEIPAELFELPSLTHPYLHQCNFTGTVPSTLTGATGLQRLYLHENKLEGPLPFVDLPDGQAKVVLTGNFFSFDDVKQYHDSAATFAAFTDDYQLAQEDQHFALDEGDSVSFELYVKDGESYAWFYSADPSPVTTDTIYTISSVVPTDTGTYVCKVQSSIVPNFDIRAIFMIDTVIAEIVPDSPQLQSAASSTDGTTISLTFDLDMADPSAEAASFTFTEGGTEITVSSVALDGSNAKVVVLTLATAISSSTATLEVSYAPGMLQSAEGGKAEAFGPTNVTNNYTTAVREPIASDVMVYPNPSTDFVTIESSSELKSVRIMDITGKTVLSQNNLDGTKVSLSVQDINSGIYFMSVELTGSTFVQKITKK